MTKPKNERFIKIKTIPAIKQSVPLTFCGLEKKYAVFFGPMIKTKPMMNKTFPIANSAESNRATIPKKKSRHPQAVKNTPNSVKKYYFFVSWLVMSWYG